MKFTYWLFISLFMVITAQAADKIILSEKSNSSVAERKTSEERGKKLHDSECISCHTPKSYISKDHKVKDFAHLNTFVQMCATNLDKSWFEEDVADVANYLNTEYYKFPIKTE
ncbi:MAG TPA: hypothetical protein ENK59_09490 [Thioploca sp.]|nr:hypothetical protein [Thioploca sp.]